MAIAAKQVPDVLWAQRTPHVWVTIDLPGVKKDATVQLLPEGRIIFSGVGGTDKKQYELNLELYEAIDTEESKYEVKPRFVEIFLKKKEGKWWPRLGKTKARNIKVDWNRWLEEGEEEKTFPGIGNAGMGGMDFGGMPDMSGMGDLGDLGGADHDSDDDEIPELDTKEDKKAETEEAKPEEKKPEEEKKLEVEHPEEVKPPEEKKPEPAPAPASSS